MFPLRNAACWMTNGNLTSAKATNGPRILRKVSHIKKRLHKRYLQVEERKESNREEGIDHVNSVLDWNILATLYKLKDFLHTPPETLAAPDPNLIRAIRPTMTLRADKKTPKIIKI